MTSRLPALVATLAVALALPLGIGAAADAKPKPKKADLVVQTVSQAASAGVVTVGATVKDKGSKKAGAGAVRFTLSLDAAPSTTDPVLGTLATPKLKPHKKASVAARFAVPTGTAAGTYVVIACADADGQVKEKNETNNCKVAAGTVTVTPVVPPVTRVIVTYSTSGVPATPLPSAPTITATATGGGTCTTPASASGSCSVPPGASTVTLTAPQFGINYVFQGWKALDATHPCDGTVGALPGTTITLTNPTAAKGCVATYAGAA